MIPLDGIEEKVLEHVPRDVTLTVTASPVKGIEATFALVERLTASGYTVVPHLSARLVESHARLAELMAHADDLGIRDVFVIAGDAEEPAGPFEGALPLLEAMHDIGHSFAEIGIAGYPESHPFIADETITAAMSEKARFATYIASQVCFDPTVTARWVEGRVGPRHTPPGLRRRPRSCVTGKAPACLGPHRDRPVHAVPSQERLVRVAIPSRRFQP